MRVGPVSQEKSAALIPLLQRVQAEQGYLSREALREIARELRIPESKVYGVATFYAQFKLTRQGRHSLKVCQGTACHVKGAPRLLRTVEAELGIQPGGATPDFQFSLERVACFGSCALAPVIVLDERVYAKMTPPKAKELLSRYGRSREAS
ncbi:MAG: NADH-quinone oxidoreductase subunit NuoE [Candidatus Bipolaricaulota bacterium]|nr:NADH-quinone oxidoreductase subunit NuoE [Candidatus Bipolaricaulota bacterium]MDW8140729.1 NADH-quinone oxidoreductase subunit NuoE [Candidatus Bipolaricaulota bacterium]